MRGLFLAASLVLAPATASGGDSPRIAVLATSSGVSKSVAAAVASAIVETARQTGAEAISPEEVSSAVVGAGGDVATCGSNAACAAAACSAVGANALLASSVREITGGWLIEMRLRDGRRGSLRGGSAASSPKNEQAARAAAARLTKQLVAPLVSPGAPPPATAQPASPKQATEKSASATRPQEPARTEGRAAETRPEDDESATSAEKSLSAAPPSRRTLDESLAKDSAESKAALSSRSRWGVILACGGAALLGVGAAAGALAWSESDRATGLLAIGDMNGYAGGRDYSQTLAWTAVGLAGAGTAALAAGVWLRIDSPAVSLEVEPGIAGARVAVAF